MQDVLQRVEQRLAQLDAGSAYVDYVALCADIRLLVYKGEAWVPNKTLIKRDCINCPNAICDECDGSKESSGKASMEVTMQAITALNRMSPVFAMDDGRSPADVLRSYIQLTGQTK